MIENLNAVNMYHELPTAIDRVHFKVLQQSECSDNTALHNIMRCVGESFYETELWNVRVDMCETLIKAGASVHVQNTEGRTPLEDVILKDFFTPLQIGTMDILPRFSVLSMLICCGSQLDLSGLSEQMLFKFEQFLLNFGNVVIKFMQRYGFRFRYVAYSQVDQIHTLLLPLTHLAGNVIRQSLHCNAYIGCKHLVDNGMIPRDTAKYIFNADEDALYWHYDEQDDDDDCEIFYAQFGYLAARSKF